MQNITELCKRFNRTSEIKKLPAHFMLLKSMSTVRQNLPSKTGFDGCTMIPDEYLGTFLSWLSPEFRLRIERGEPALEVLKHLDNSTTTV